MSASAWLWLLLSLLALVHAAKNPEVSWGDWIILDEAEPGTSILLRRITPKSVFVAPTFNSCSEGYRQDSLGRCVKLVKVNQQAQWNFFLERLNSMYAPSSTSKNPQKESGPFHISLPIGNEGSQEDVIVKKRLPPKIRVESVRTTKQPSTTSSTTTTMTTLLPQTTTTTSAPTTMMQESTTLEVQQSTTVDPSDVNGVDKEQTESTTETRRDVTTESPFNVAAMLGDQPVSTEDFSDKEILETPKNSKENSTQLQEKPFVIIVTNDPTTSTEGTTPFTPLSTEVEGEEDIRETPSTTEVTTEGTTETNSMYTTESAQRTTEYDESLSETKEVTETSIRSTVKSSSSSTVRSKCDLTESQVRDDLFDPSDCEPAETENISGDKNNQNPSVSLPASLPLLEPSTQVRFPSESFVPVRKTQSFVRFPEVSDPHEDRPSFWWPSWQVRQHPGIRGWPSAESQSSDQVINRQYPPYSSWSDSTAWHRRFFQRD